MKGEVGKIIGEASPYEFNFAIFNPLDVKKGDYVKVWNDADGWFVAYVTDIRAISKITDDEIINGRNAEKERFIGKAVIIGKRDGKMLKLPRTPFVPGERVFLAEDDFVVSALGLDEDGLYVGLLGDTSIKVKLNPNSVVQKHVCILAKTGSGKSYTAGVLIEELLEKGVPLLIIDPHGEYCNLKDKNDNPDDIEKMKIFGISQRDYADRVVMFVPPKSPFVDVADGILRLNGLNLSPEEIIEMGEIRKSSAQALIYHILRELREREVDYTIRDVIDEIYNTTTNIKGELIGALSRIEDSELFSENPTPINVLFQRGKAIILNLAGIEPVYQEIIVSKVCREIFEMRKRKEIPAGMIVIDEAHNFIPEKGERAISTSVLRTIASEGRKFGLGLMVISQRPARIDKNVLSQCNTQIILRLTNPNDINAIKKGVEGITPEMVEEIKRLPIGTALIVSPDIERPILVRVRVRKSKHKEAEIVIEGKKKKVRERKEKVNKKDISFFKKVFGG